ncbi:MAG: putative antitoxin, contains HTH domain [Candidatus Methanocomedens sp.]|nr:MAG: putative antitoxin, contains HTH domain [ANME-2 cluster archaeon]
MTYNVVSLRIAPGMLKEINRLAHEEHVERSTFLRELLDKGLKETKIEHAVEQYKQSKISIGRMVEITGISRHELFEKLKEHGISVHYSKNRLLREISDL